MFCKNCGAEIDDKAVACPHCGVATGNLATANSSNGTAVAGLIFAFIFPLIGLIVSCVGLSKSKSCNGKGKGCAIAGIIISILEMISGIGIITWWFLA